MNVHLINRAMGNEECKIQIQKQLLTADNHSFHSSS